MDAAAALIKTRLNGSLAVQLLTPRPHRPPRGVWFALPLALPLPLAALPLPLAALPLPLAALPLAALPLPLAALPLALPLSLAALPLAC